MDVSAGARPSKITFQIQSPEPLGEARLRFSEKYIFPQKNDSLNVTPQRRIASGHLQTADGDLDELLIRTEYTNAIYIELESETPFVLVRPGLPPEETMSIKTTVTLADIISPSPPPFNDSDGLPVVRLWFTQTPR